MSLPAAKLTGIARRLRDAIRGETASTFFDVRNSAAVADLLGTAGTAGPARDAQVELARRLFETRPDLRDSFPLGLTPAGRAGFLRWLVVHGGIEAASAVRMLTAIDATPDRGLALTYRVTPAWQSKHPHALTRGGWDHFKRWIADEYRCPGRWLRRARPAEFEEPTAAVGANLLAHWRYPSGLREEASQFADGLTRAGLPFSRRDIPLSLASDAGDGSPYLDLERYPVSIAKTGALEPFDDLFAKSGLHPRSGVYRIAAWSWELADFPAETVRTATKANEFWAPSRFGADAIACRVTDRPVLAMPPGVAMPEPSPVTRSQFGLSPDRTLFLFAFDMASVPERKNPLGLIAAFRRAFRPADRAQLVLKISRGDSDPIAMTELRTAAGNADVCILDGVLSRGESFGLMALADCYVSLHRAEGFGFTTAEAMLLGKPVIATNYSATTEYMTHQNSRLVDFDLVPLDRDFGPYPRGSVWAEPSISHAATLMRWVYENPENARELGARAKADARKSLDPEAAGRRIADRVRAIVAGERR